MVPLCPLGWGCCGQSCGGGCLGAPLPALLGGCTEADAPDLAGQRAAPQGRVSWEPRAVCLDLWPCWESSSLTHNLSVSCQASLSVLSMETWRAAAWRVQGSCPEQHCRCLGNTREDFLRTRNAESSYPGPVVMASHLQASG